MKNDGSDSSVGGYKNSSLDGKIWNNGITRRRFLKRAGAASSGAMLAMSAMSLEAAEPSSGVDSDKGIGMTDKKVKPTRSSAGAGKKITYSCTLTNEYGEAVSGTFYWQFKIKLNGVWITYGAPPATPGADNWQSDGAETIPAEDANGDPGEKDVSAKKTVSIPTGATKYKFELKFVPSNPDVNPNPLTGSTTEGTVTP